MAVRTYVDKHLARWLEPYTTDLTEHALVARTAAVKDLARQIKGATVLRAVAAAHAADLSREDRSWLGEVAHDHDDTFVNAGKDGLLGVMVAAAVASGLSERPSRRRAMLAYAVQSAAFCGMEPSWVRFQPWPMARSITPRSPFAAARVFRRTPQM